MKLESLAYASIEKLFLKNLNVISTNVNALHCFAMEPVLFERFVYITKGEACFFADGKEFYAKEWDMVYLPKNTSYRSKWLKESQFVVVDMCLCSEDGADIRLSEEPCVLFNDTHRLYDGLIAELGQKSKLVGPFDWLERIYLSFRFLCNIARDTANTEFDERYNCIKRGVTYLENNFAEEFSVDDLASMCAVSTGYFRRLFAECKGTSPADYKNRLRIGRASELLRSGNYTVGEVAEQVGIKDVKYFSKLFNRYVGMKPSDLKKGIMLKDVE